MTPFPPTIADGEHVDQGSIAPLTRRGRRSVRFFAKGNAGNRRGTDMMKTRKWSGGRRHCTLTVVVSNIKCLSCPLMSLFEGSCRRHCVQWLFWGGCGIVVFSRGCTLAQTPAARP